MTGTTEVDRKTGTKKVVYFCTSYKSGKSNGQKTKCGAYRITHVAAEQLLTDKLKELNIEFDQLRSDMAKAAAESEVAKLSRAGIANVGKWLDLVSEGEEELARYFKEHYKVTPKALEAYCEKAGDYYNATPAEREQFAKRFRDMVLKAETECVETARKKVQELTKDHAAYTKSWGLGDDRRKAVLDDEIKKIDEQLKIWEPRKKTISERLGELTSNASDNINARKKLLDELPTLDSRAKGEALRRIFKTVKLFWKATFHPNEKSPSRERTTNRKGRYGYELLPGKIDWELESINPNGCS
jgi:hypothetical protein